MSTCHQPGNGWALSAESVEDRFNADPNDPLFRLIDGATCPTADISTLAAKRKAYSLLISKGLIRIGLPMDPSMQFEITSVQDPYNCTVNSSDPKTGLTNSKTGFVSFYRRPLPSANLPFLTSIMWDGREPTLFHQANDATLGHAEGDKDTTTFQQRSIVSFEGCTKILTWAECGVIQEGEGVFAAQVIDQAAGDLTADGARGGPVVLAEQSKQFFMCQNDPLGCNPTKQAFNPKIFDIFGAWLNLTGTDKQSEARRSIARGEVVFNTVPMKITEVAGLNDALGKPSSMDLRDVP